MTAETISEKLFEEFCEQNRIPCEPAFTIEEGSTKGNKPKNPDYKIVCSGHTIIVEIKELDLSPSDKLRQERLLSEGSTGVFDSENDRRIRGEIADAMRQLKPFAKGKHPALIVIYNKDVLLPADSNDIRRAMYVLTP